MARRGRAVYWEEDMGLPAWGGVVVARGVEPPTTWPPASCHPPAAPVAACHPLPRGAYGLSSRTIGSRRYATLSHRMSLRKQSTLQSPA